MGQLDCVLRGVKTYGTTPNTARIGFGTCTEVKLTSFPGRWRITKFAAIAHVSRDSSNVTNDKAGQHQVTSFPSTVHRHVYRAHAVTSPNNIFFKKPPTYAQRVSNSWTNVPFLRSSLGLAAVAVRTRVLASGHTWLFMNCSGSRF